MNVRWSRAASAPIAQVATSEQFVLAEGPVWDPRDQVLSWVDITCGAIHRGTLRTDGTIGIAETVVLPGEVGTALPGPCGDLVLAVDGAIVHRSADGALTVLAQVVPSEDAGPPALRRINDGAADPSGRLLVGTLHDGDFPHREVLVRLEADGAVTTMDQDLGLSNGLAWSVDGSFLYSVDTLRRVVYRRPYDRPGHREVHLEFTAGYPDGICVDSEDHLWVAMWGIGEVHRYDPDGALAAIIDVPAPHTTSVAFAGPFLETLVITTARSGLGDAELAAWPLSGRIFTATPGVRGWPRPLWSGIHTAAERERQP